MGKISKSQHILLYAETCGSCIYCGRPIPFSEFTIDHIIPLRRGGTSKVSNTVCACLECNRQKRDLSVLEFFQYNRSHDLSHYIHRIKTLYEGGKISEDKMLRLTGRVTLETWHCSHMLQLGRFLLVFHFYRWK